MIELLNDPLFRAEMAPMFARTLTALYGIALVLAVGALSRSIIRRNAEPIAPRRER